MKTIKNIMLIGLIMSIFISPIAITGTDYHLCQATGSTISSAYEKVKNTIKKGKEALNDPVIIECLIDVTLIGIMSYCLYKKMQPQPSNFDKINYAFHNFWNKNAPKVGSAISKTLENEKLVRKLLCEQ